MRVFVTLLVPVVSLLNVGVQAATISTGLISRVSDDLVTPRQFHNADFNSGSSSPESHAHHHNGEHGRMDSSSNTVSRRKITLPDPTAALDTSSLGVSGSNTQKASRSLDSTSGTVSRRQIPQVSDLPVYVVTQASTVLASTPVGPAANSLSGSPSRRQASGVSEVPQTLVDAASTLAGSTPAGSVLGSVSSAASRRQVSVLPAPVSLEDVDLSEATNLANLISGSSSARDLKDLAEEDIEATDDDIDKDLEDVPHPIDVLSDSPDLSKDRESSVERRQANVTALQSAVFEQELVKSLASATGQA